MKRLRSFYRLLLGTTLAALVAACGENSASPTAPLATASPAVTASAPPALTATASVTPTESAATATTALGSVPTPTPVPPELAVIEPANAAGLQQVAQLGRGSLMDVRWSPDGKRLAVATSLGISLYDLDTLKETGVMTTGVDAPRQLFFSPDGGTLAALMMDESVRLWDVSAGAGAVSATPARTLTWTDRAAPVLYGVTFSPDWHTLAWVARGTVQFMDVASGQLLAALGHEDFVQQIAFSPDGRRLATTFGGVKLWDVASGEELQTLIPYGEALNTNLVFSPDGKVLVTASGDGVTKVWDVATGQERLTLTGTNAAFSPDGQMLVTTSGEGTVSMWAVGTALQTGATNAQVALTLKGDNPVFSPDGHTLAVKADETTIKLVDIASGQERQSLGQPAPVVSFAFLPDGSRLQVTLADQSVALWDAASGQPVWNLAGFMGPVMGLAFAPDGKSLATGSTDRFDLGTIRLWSVAGTSAMQTLAWRAHADAVQDLAFSPDGKTLASASLDMTVKLWDPATGAEAHTLNGHTAQVYGVAFAPDGRTLASASFDQTVKVWDSSSGAEALTLTGHAAGVWAVAFSPQGGLLASGADDGMVKIWDASTGRELFNLNTNAFSVTGLAFSPDGHTLAVATSTGSVQLWDAATGQSRLALAGHPDNQVSSVVFSPSGSLLASAALDGSIKLWDAANGEELASVGQPPQEAGGALLTISVEHLAFAPDGRLIAAAMSDGTLRLWGVAGP